MCREQGVIQRGGQTHRHDVLTLHGYCRAEDEEKLKEFMREKEKKRNNINKAADKPLQNIRAEHKGVGC